MIGYIALGSNVGDRSRHLMLAVAAIAREGVAVTRRSGLYETAPVGGPQGQGAYLNAVVEVETDLTPEELFAVLCRIENELGRERLVYHGPRTIDLDLLMMGNETRTTPTLHLPHPRMHERLFVLEPMAEMAPGVVHPVLGKTVAQLRADLTGVTALGMSPGRELAGLRVLVTGSTGGIGRAIALELASAGAWIVVHGRRDGDEVAEAIHRRGGRAEMLRADLREQEGCQRLAATAWEAFGALDAVINNAGADTLTGEAAHWSFERKLEELLRVDVLATLMLSRDLGQRMKARGRGVVVNMGWDQAETGMEGDSGELFATTKGAVMCFSRSLALSLSPEVRVHCLAPGWIRTAWGETASAVWQERVQRETPQQRWGTPEDVAVATRWLLSPRAGYFHGQTVKINGGAIR
ncbi:MAG: 2-amino-4-hydroxy-6-hydroxymethyldihydropteridine diphosphokinase [Planctomycetia bacterium]|nr:2-amino-4-hydroxy-6-hydroxymethyldihydropteridine diphosphokinase [Planctomycetia bacterium]